MKNGVIKSIPAKQEARNLVFSSILRTMFFARITQMELDNSGRLSLITDEVKEAQQRVFNSLVNYQQKICKLMDTENEKWLRKELIKDKLYDMGNLLEIAAQVEGDEYEDIFYMMSQFLRRLFEGVQSGKPINKSKYVAMFQSLEADLLRDIQGLPPAIIYDEQTDTLTLNNSRNANNRTGFNRATTNSRR